MSVETSVSRARTRVERERELVADERRAYDRFREAVRSLTPSAPTGASKADATTHGRVPTAAAFESRAPAASQRRRVREAFAETVRPCSVADRGETEPLQATIRAELGERVALALADERNGFTPRMKEATLAKVAERRAERELLSRALDRETESLRTAGDAVETVVEWLTAAEETPLSALGFDALRARHETLDAHRDRCGEVARERQRHLQSSTCRDASTRLSHRSLGAFLYQEFSVDYPVLATAARLANVLTDCQRTVREHLIRRA
jgi:hypothetical protein